MPVIATGRWSKREKRWLMVVAVRRPAAPAVARPTAHDTPPRHR